jgi:hypothetical protein
MAKTPVASMVDPQPKAKRIDVIASFPLLGLLTQRGMPIEKGALSLRTRPGWGSSGIGTRPVGSGPRVARPLEGRDERRLLTALKKTRATIPS